MDAQQQPGRTWSEYYEAVGARPPREFYRQAVGRFETPGRALDLGCGSGVEARDLLARGWRVHAFDKQESALEGWPSILPEDEQARLQVTVAAFEELALPPADFIWAGLSLPFCAPESFERLWSGIVAALVPGGRFAGDLFGVRHAWAKREGMTFHAREDVEALAGPLEVEYVQEGQGTCATACDGFLPWHMISLCLRKPTRGA